MHCDRCGGPLQRKKAPDGIEYLQCETCGWSLTGNPHWNLDSVPGARVPLFRVSVKLSGLKPAQLARLRALYPVLAGYPLSRLTSASISEAFPLSTMTREQLRELLRAFPELASRVDIDPGENQDINE